MLHMKLNSAVSIFAVAAAFSVLLPPSNAYGGICFLPDCMDEDVVQGDFNMNLNEDTEYCEKEGYTYYASGKCPQYQDVIGTCSRDDHYLKCDAETWCKNNGYNTTSCSLPSYLNEKCPNDYPLYKECKEDTDRACREAGYVNSCSPGRLYANSNRCPWDSSYGKCCTASPSSGCPSNYGVDCTGSASGTDACGYTCYRCCDDNCPSGTSKNYSGSVSTYTECGTACKRCKDCTSGSTSYSGSYVGSSECGSCYACSDTCRTGSKSVSCSSTEDKVRVSSTECGSSCYECQYNSDCSVSSKSCSYGCASYNSCGKCTSCDSCSNSCSRGSTSSYCSSGYTAKAVGSTQCGNTCYTCVEDIPDEPDDPCDGVTGKTCASGYHCSSYGSCGECTACAKDEVKNPCAGVTCPTAKSCSNGCASYSTATSCCSRVCTECITHTHSYSCPSGYSTHSCPAGYSILSTANQTCSCGATTSVTCYTCISTPAHTHSYSCPSGYRSSSCPSGYTVVGTTSKTCSCGATGGGTCYKCESKCAGNPCAAGCYTDIDCGTSRVCDAWNACGGCSHCKTRTMCAGGIQGTPCVCGGVHGIGDGAGHWCD